MYGHLNKSYKYVKYKELNAANCGGNNPSIHCIFKIFHKELWRKQINVAYESTVISKKILGHLKKSIEKEPKTKPQKSQAIHGRSPPLKETLNIERKPKPLMWSMLTHYTVLTTKHKDYNSK